MSLEKSPFCDLRVEKSLERLLGMRETRQIFKPVMLWTVLRDKSNFEQVPRSYPQEVNKAQCGQYTPMNSFLVRVTPISGWYCLKLP